MKKVCEVIKIIGMVVLAGYNEEKFHIKNV